MKVKSIGNNTCFFVYLGRIITFGIYDFGPHALVCMANKQKREILVIFHQFHFCHWFQKLWFMSLSLIETKTSLELCRSWVIEIFCIFVVLVISNFEIHILADSYFKFPLFLILTNNQSFIKTICRLSDFLDCGAILSMHILTTFSTQNAKNLLVKFA